MDMKDTERATLNVLFGINAFSNISSIEMLVGDCKWLEYKLSMIFYMPLFLMIPKLISGAQVETE